MEPNQILLDLLDRTARIEENQNFIRSNIRDLPQSPQCQHDIAELRAELLELESFKTEVEKKVAYIGGVLISLGMVVPYVFNWVASHIHWRSP
jgi:hypothetical protein